MFTGKGVIMGFNRGTKLGAENRKGHRWINNPNNAHRKCTKCGSRMFWFDKHNPLVLFVDKRSETLTAKDKDRIRTIDVKPDVIADFTNLPFEDNSFYMVVFDPPHLKTLGETSWMAKKYGKLPKDWKSLIHDGFIECMRVLKPNGTLIFKWNESEIKASEVLSVIPFKPLFGHTTGRQSKTIWMCFMKREDDE